MDKRHLFAWVAALVLAGAAPATAVDNVSGSDATRCSCWCDFGAGRPVVPNLVYDAGSFGCSALEGRTCNAEDPTQPGLIRSGRVQLCEPLIEMQQATVPGGQGGWTADPVPGGQGGWGQHVAPLPGIVFERQ